jgi:hypothetical protein
MNDDVNEYMSVFTLYLPTPTTLFSFSLMNAALLLPTNPSSILCCVCILKELIVPAITMITL